MYIWISTYNMICISLCILYIATLLNQTNHTKCNNIVPMIVYIDITFV